MNAYDKLQNEGGEGYVSFDKRYPKQPTKAEQDEILAKSAAELDAAFAAEWTKEVTATRRAKWNAEAVKFGHPRKAEIALGFTMRDLKKAVVIYA